MKLSQIISRGSAAGKEPPELYTIRKHTPWIASPLEKIEPKSGHGSPQQSTHDAVKAPQEHSHEHDHHHHIRQVDHETPHFKHHHESSTIELFYDLFFVANLSSFTNNHEITDTKSLKNYVGFFTILWFTWLQTSLFDVRFATDSAFNRLCKACSFGVMTGFAITGAIYNTAEVADNLKAFRALALILMVSRLVLVGQYATVLYYVKEYRRTHLPLFATMATLFIAAIVYLGTFWGYKEGGDSFPIQHDGEYTYVAYYVVAVCEAFSVIVISCIWRIVSFKHTHLVERVGLLTLIIMGEGIIGMTHSVSKIIQNSVGISASDIGTIISAVLLIYFIWILYFDQIENDRFGTIRQQIWALLHFPLHVAILLTVEGSTALILWNIISQIDTKWGDIIWADILPLDSNNNYNFTSFENAGEVIEYVNKSVETISKYFKTPEAFEEAYNSTENIIQLQKLNQTFGGVDWAGNASNIIYNLAIGVENAIFASFGVEGSESEGGTESSTAGESVDQQYDSLSDQNDNLFNLYSTVFTYFPIAAGVFLIILAVLYWFGKKHKTPGEWGSIVVRVVAGIGLCMAALAAWFGNDASENFLWSPWIMVVVMLGFFVVIILDNILVWSGNRSVHRRSNAGSVIGSDPVLSGKHARGESSEGGDEGSVV